MGQGLTGRTLGVVGLGNTGREVLRLAAPFGLRHIGCDPHVDHGLLAGLNVEVVDLESLLGTADYVVLCTALVPDHGVREAGRILVGVHMVVAQNPEVAEVVGDPRADGAGRDGRMTG